MNLQPQRTADYLRHMIQAMERIQHYTQAMTLEAFLTEPLVQDAVIRNLEVLGEASHNIEKRDPAFAAAHPELPLAFAYQMRNALAHGYFKVDLEIVWRTVQRDLPRLLAQVQGMVGQM